MNEKFDETKWFGVYIGKVSIDFEKLDNIRNFVFFWSLFESIVCHNNANANSICNGIDRLIKRAKLNLDDYMKFYDYFENRYTDKITGEVNPTFDSLNFRNRDKKEFVKSILESETNEASEIIRLCPVFSWLT